MWSLEWKPDAVSSTRYFGDNRRVSQPLSDLDLRRRCILVIQGDDIEEVCDGEKRINHQVFNTALFCKRSGKPKRRHVPNPHYSENPMRFGSSGSPEFVSRTH